MYSGAHRGTVEDRSRQGPSHDTWHTVKKKKKAKRRWGGALKGKNRREGEREREEEAAPVVQEGRKFVYILVGFTRECLSRQTAAGLPSQQLINNTHTHIAHTHTHSSLFLPLLLPPSFSAREEEECAGDCAQRKT